MQVAVAGVEHIGDAQPVMLRQFAHALEHLRQSRPRDGAIHAVVVGRDASDRRERRLAAGPEQQPLLFGGRDLAARRPARCRDRLDTLDQMIDLGLRAVDLDDQQGFHIERIAGVDEFLDRVDRRPVHHLHAARDDAGADNPADAFAGVLRRRKADQHRAGAFGLLEDPHRDLGDDAEQALGSGDDAEQVVAAGIEMLAADADDLAGDQHDLAAQEVVGGHAVFQAMHAPGVLRHVAADRAGDLRRRIGRIIEPGMLDCLRDGEIGDARLDHRDAVVEIDFFDTVELGHAEQHAILKRQSSARQRGTGAARHHFDALGMAVSQHAADLLGGRRQHHHHGKLPIGGEPVRLVGPHLALGRDHTFARHDGAQSRHHAVAA